MTQSTTIYIYAASYNQCVQEEHFTACLCQKMLNQKVYKIDFNLSKQYVKKLILKRVYVKKISNYYN